jgi:hypothetical protein
MYRPNKEITRSMLFDSFVYGKVILLWVYDQTHKAWTPINGQVVGLSQESGFDPKSSHLKDYMVNIVDMDLKTRPVYTTYVQTID